MTCYIPPLFSIASSRYFSEKPKSRYPCLHLSIYSAVGDPISLSFGNVYTYTVNVSVKPLSLRCTDTFISDLPYCSGNPSYTSKHFSSLSVVSQTAAGTSFPLPAQWSDSIRSCSVWITIHNPAPLSSRWTLPRNTAPSFVLCSNYCHTPNNIVFSPYSLHSERSRTVLPTTTMTDWSISHNRNIATSLIVSQALFFRTTPHIPNSLLHYRTAYKKYIRLRPYRQYPHTDDAPKGRILFLSLSTENFRQISSAENLFVNIKPIPHLVYNQNIRDIQSYAPYLL